MVISKLKLAAGAGLVAAILAPLAAQADIMGSAYFVPEATAMNAVIGGSYGSAVATFSVPSPTNPACTAGETLCFDSNASGYQLGGFLTGGGATILTSVAGALTTNLDTGSQGTILQFMGDVTVMNGETFTVAHDDGLQLSIGGVLVVDAPGPTPPVTTTYTWTGASGTYMFDLVYGECCGAPAVLATSLPLVSAVPEPSTLALAAVGMLGLGFALRRRRGRA